MNERSVANRVNKILGYDMITLTDAVKCPKCGKMVLPERGRPDTVAVTFAVEHKAMCWPYYTSFDFSQIDEHQRDALDLRESYIALHIIGREKGTKEERLALGLKDKYLGAFLVPWPAWLEMEQKFIGIQDSIPYDISTMKRVGAGLRPDKDIVHLLARFRLEGTTWPKLPAHNFREWEVL